jgi:hypothetical protein
MDGDKTRGTWPMPTSRLAICSISMQIHVVPTITSDIHIITYPSLRHISLPWPAGLLSGTMVITREWGSLWILEEKLLRWAPRRAMLCCLLSILNRVLVLVESPNDQTYSPPSRPVNIRSVHSTSSALLIMDISKPWDP